MVYVDNMQARFGRMVMCHMIADTHDELVKMADTVGVARKWIQNTGTYGEHFDICLSMRAKAVKAGATEITMHDLGVFLSKRRTEPGAKAAYFATTSDTGKDR